MPFYKPLACILYPDYIPPEKFVVPLKNKFSWVIQFVLQNQKKLYIYKLITREKDKQIYYKLFTIQRRLSKFVTHVKFMYINKFNDTNLYGDPLKKRHITIIENNQMYRFDYFEMFKLIKEKIYYHQDFFLNPMMPTNPYTNVPFERHNLYNIYLQLLKSSYILPICIRLFFNVNFDLKKLVDKYSYNILTEVITHEYNQLSLCEKYDVMREMLLHFKKKIFLNVPNEKLYTIFSEQVSNYYKALFLPTWCSNMMMYQLKKYLHIYHRKHPHTGKITRNIFTKEAIVC